MSQTEQFRSLEQWVEINYKDIVDEVHKIVKSTKSMNIGDLDHAHAQLMTDSSAWRVIWLKYLGRKVNVKGKSINSLIDCDMIFNASISILLPGGEIPIHRGSCRGLIKYHIPIDIPSGDIGIEYNGKVYHWEHPMLFDDTQYHRVWNHTQHTRIVILIDLHRPMGYWTILSQRIASLSWLTSEPQQAWKLITNSQNTRS
jgi:hypothetical protein